MLETTAPPLTFVAPADLSPPRATPAADPVAALRERMQSNGQWQDNQIAGRRWPVACVSLEITQRCNLDCTLCYLSEASEAVHDLPLEEVMRRIDMIHAHYGPGTDVQVSGGEPTLRQRNELLAIVARLHARGLRAALFTNGIKASRELLADLAQAGLTDVAFHVDTTQERAGYTDEASLNALRLEYIERARGLPLHVFFNTTVHADNVDDVPMLARFFVDHAHGVDFASFQLQADTGRGVQGGRSGVISNESIAALLSQGAGTPLSFNTLLTGHTQCNRSAVMLVANRSAHDAFADTAFVTRFMRETVGMVIERGTAWRGAVSLVRAALARPRLAVAALRWMAALAWRVRTDLLAARGRARKLTFFTHNFMDAQALERERIDACVFMVMTQHGPISMCAYNARRDHYLLQPITTSQGVWQPLAGRRSDGNVAVFPIKFLKGRTRAAAMAARTGDRGGVRDIAREGAREGVRENAPEGAR
jgi:7,8-dihydro-6-hydroxymethylpterin dimethyltransferase